ncbi:EAL domain-containing protein [Solimonas terrae]|uniref:EAL domain-containing protein n=1 Tax=Solimonas terrae TaxID=1396819 RepID=A0A6M2BL44_9GAMM|nr:EAL domain-containing protein [Solimonas terrae]NGY03238.1 EAL domain-containing protein [Solimonas terrae]
MKVLERLRDWLDDRRAVWGELNYQIYVALLIFTLAFMVIGIVLTCMLIPAGGVFVYGEHILSGAQMRRQVLWPYLGVVVLMTALIYMHLVRVLITPVERMRRQLQQRRGVNAPAQANAPYDRHEVQLLEVAVQNAQRQLQDRQALLLQQADSIGQLEQSRNQSELRHRALLDAVGDAVLEVDAELRISAASAAAAQLLIANRNALIDKPLKAAVRLFDVGQKDWLNHPLDGAIERVLRSDAAVPCLFEALLLNDRSEETRLTIMVTPYGGAARQDGGVISLRVEGDSGPAMAPLSVAAAASDLEHGLPNNLAFRRRAMALIESARHDAREHTAAIFLIGGLRDEDDPTDQQRHTLAEVLARNLRRSLDGDAELYRIGGIAFGILKPDARPAAMLDLFETIRALCQLELSRQVSGDVTLTVRYAASGLDAKSEGIDVLMSELVAQITNRIAVGVQPRQSDSIEGEGDLLARRAQWVSERLLDRRLHLVSQSVLPAVPSHDTLPWLEVFARIEDDDGHWLEPAHFLKAVEHAGEAGRLDAAVFQRVLETCSSAPDLLTRYAGISLNISAQSLGDDFFLNEVIGRARASGIAASRFAVEIDHGAIQLSAGALAGLELLRASGIRTIVDGCNDLRSLRLMASIQPFLIKLSGDFIAAAEHDSVIGAELQAIISSAKVMGVLLSAKNVSGAGQFRKLAELGISYAQGSGLETLGPILG